MLFIKIKILLSFLIILTGCGLSKNTSIKSYETNNIIIETPNNKFNLIFKNKIKRIFNNKTKSDAKFVLKADLGFSSGDVSSQGSSNNLISTKAIVKYSLVDLTSDTIIKSGSINTFSALSSSSTSLYTNDISLEHVKERLTLTAAKKLYMVVRMVLQKIN
jgi:hypothetical protein